MACKIPGCRTKYWDPNNKNQMFKAPDNGTLKSWQEILKEKDVDQFESKDKICILHFEEEALERTRKIHLRGGIVQEKVFVKPLLRCGAIPTIFPSIVSPKRKKLTHAYAVEIENVPPLQNQIPAKQMEIFGQITMPKVLQKTTTKRKLENESNLSGDVETKTKQKKTNDIYYTIRNQVDKDEQVSPYLSNLWVTSINSNKEIVWALWKENCTSIEKTIILDENLKVDVFMNQKRIHLEEPKNIREMPDLQKLFHKVTCLLPCIGANDKSRNAACVGYVTKNFGRQRMRCFPCKNAQRNFKRKLGMEERISKIKTGRQRSYVQCSTLQRKNNNLQRKILKLERKVKALHEKCSKTKEETLNEVIKNLSPAEQCNVRTCIKASQVKNLKGMRYTTQWIYECLLLRIKSRKAYDHLQRRRILVLPHVSTLNKYIKNIAGCYGFNSNLFEVLKNKTENMKPDEVRGVLLLDEMKLTKSLAFNRRNLKVEGFTDLGQYTPHHQKGKRGDHALVFMFQPFKHQWVQALACFLSKGSASGTVLHQLIIECIILAERAGLRIDVVTTDGATWNRNMWKLFGVTKDNISVPHIVDNQRQLWFTSDFPHLIKCMRNFFIRSNRDRSTPIWTPDGDVKLLHWYALLKIENEKTFNLKVNYKLTEEHLNPRFYKKMNVALAFQFFGVADGMELFKEMHSDLADCEPSIILCRKVKSLITAMNSRTPLNKLTPGNEMWKIIEEFIVYLDEWEEEAKKRGFDFLPNSTCYGLQISLRATLEICTFLVNECEGFSYLMTGRLNQDSLERYFGLMRDCCGSNDHPDSTLFIQMYRLVSTYSLVKPPKGSNISGGEVLDVLINLKDVTDADERWELWSDQLDTIVDKGTRCDQLSEAAELIDTHDYFVTTTSDYVLTYISGFVARRTSRFVTFAETKHCEECTRSLLLDPEDEIPESHKLINLRSYGYLKHPSKALFDLISILERCTLETIWKTDLNTDTLFDITKAIEELPGTPCVGCPEHSFPLTHRIITFYITMRMFFICKQANKNDSKEKDQTCEKRKLSRLTCAQDSAKPREVAKNNETASTTTIPKGRKK